MGFRPYVAMVSNLDMFSAKACIYYFSSYFPNVLFCLKSKRNEELSIELLNLVNAKATLMKQVQAMSDSDHGLGDPDAEISRVKAIVIKNSSGKIKVC